VEASFAGALGLRLGGRTVYPYGVQDRPVLGDGRPPAVADLTRAVRLSRAVGLAAAILGVAVSAWGPR
jgi:adenosylcobinamide-phosphate synthase